MCVVSTHPQPTNVCKGSCVHQNVLVWLHRVDDALSARVACGWESCSRKEQMFLSKTGQYVPFEFRVFVIMVP